MSLRVLVGSLVAALLLSACGPMVVYEYTAPKSAEGRVCTSQCGNQRNYCIQGQQQNVNQCQMNYNNMMHNYHQCVNAGGKYCSMPAACPGVNTWYCDESYRGCFTSCGGHVTPHVVKDDD